MIRSNDSKLNNVRDKKWVNPSVKEVTHVRFHHSVYETYLRAWDGFASKYFELDEFVVGKVGDYIAPSVHSLPGTGHDMLEIGTPLRELQTVDYYPHIKRERVNEESSWAYTVDPSMLTLGESRQRVAGEKVNQSMKQLVIESQCRGKENMKELKSVEHNIGVAEELMEENPMTKVESEQKELVHELQASASGDGRHSNYEEIHGLDEELDDSAALYVAAMHCIPNMGATAIRKLIDYLGAAKLAWRVMYDIEKRNEVLEEDMAIEYAKFYVSREEADLIFHNLQRDMYANDINVISYLDDDFPHQLEEIYNPPAVLFYKGNFGLLKEVNKSVAMVGARSCTTYGRQVAHSFSKYLAEQGVIIISGGARGVDTFSHQGSLDARRMPTIAIMGCGLAITYPWENKSLFEKILNNRGLLLSEYPPYVPAHARNFPMRNRLIGGLARATVVVEAKASSGSLITADMASNNGRDVFAVPGNVLTPFAEGNHWLLRQGAYVLTHPKYLMEEYGWETEDPMLSEVMQEFYDSKETEDTICQHLSPSEIVSIDDLLQCTDMSREKIFNILVQLEMKGIVKKCSAQGYILTAQLS